MQTNNTNAGGDASQEEIVPEPPTSIAGDFVTGQIDASDSDESGDGFESDPIKRKVIENHADDIAINYYTRRYKVETKGKPIDLICKNAFETIHVEVKRSRSMLKRVIFTINEVNNARNPDWRTELFLVDYIELEKSLMSCWWQLVGAAGYKTIGIQKTTI